MVLEKMSKVMGDVFNKDEGASGLADGDAADEEEAAEDEPITLHSCARDGESCRKAGCWQTLSHGMEFVR